jgi:hypothetical protein
VAADHANVLDPRNGTKWENAIGRLGIDTAMLSSESGQA